MINDGRISRDQLCALLRYEPDTGVFSRLASVDGRLGKTKVGTRTYGYLAIRIFGVRYQAHRLAWLYMNGEWPPHDIDHVNGDRSDNRWCNLRSATRAQNLANSRRPRTNSSGIKGVSFDVERGCWQAQIKPCGRRIFLGRFHTPQEAGDAYAEAAKKYFGEFARVA